MAWNEQAERVRARISRRAFGYRATFTTPNPQGLLIDTAPWWAFWRKATPAELSPAAEIVLADLAEYCYARKPTLKVSQADGHTDALAMAFAEGRRDVFNRIVALCNLTPDRIDQIVHSKE